MKRILIVLVLFTGMMAQAMEIKKDTVYTNLTSFLKTLNTTKKTQATYYLKLTTLDSSQVKLRIDLKQLKVDIPIYKSAHFDIEKLLRLTNEKQLTINKKLEVFNAKVKEKIKAEKQLGVLNNELSTLKKADSTNYDSIAIAEAKIKADDKAKEVSNLLNQYNQLFEEYEQMVNEALGNIRTDYQNRLTKVIEEAYDKLESKATRFQTFDDDAWFYDIRINLLKVDATRPMKVSYTVRGGEKREEKITPGDHYFIMHFTEFGAWYEKEKIVPLFKNIKLSEASRNPFLLDEQFALVCNDKDRTQHYINMVVDYKNYHMGEEEEKTEEDFETNTMWISQFDCKQIKKIIGINCRCVAVGSSPGNNCCNQACRAILKNEDVELTGERIIIVKTDTDDNCKTKYDPVNFQKGLDHLDKSLEKGLPVLVGVQKLSKSNDNVEWSEVCTPYGNNPKSANHYLVIVSKKENQYKYYEVGTQHKSKGTAATNVFHIKGSLIESKNIDNKKYRITDIRVNKIE